MTKWISHVTVLFLLTALSAPAAEQPVQTESIRVAKELWDSAIEAKGGRERLHSIKTLVVRDKRELELFVFPSFNLFWFDLRPSAFGLIIESFNFESDRGYTLFANDQRLKEHARIIEKGYASRLAREQLMYLLETQWFRPELVVGARGKQADTVAVKVDYLGYMYRADVVLDKSTHLPNEIRFYEPLTVTKPSNILRFHKYVEVDGVMLPSLMSNPTMGTRQEIPSTFEINPEYDPEFLIKAPDITAGPYQWRKAT